MPQPYRGTEKVRFGHEAILERPALAAHIAAIATLWAGVEEAWGMILADILNSDAQVGMALYLSLSGSAAQAATLRAAAEYALTEQADRDEFGKLLKDEKGPALERNRIVHGRWGILPSRQDVLILGERNWAPRVMATLNRYYAQPVQNILEADGPKLPDFPRLKYDVRDFVAIETRMVALRKRQEAFSWKLREANRERQKEQHARELQLQSALSPFRSTRPPETKT